MTDTATPQWDWDCVENLLNDLKADGYEATRLETSTSSAAPEKDIVIHVERDSDD